MKSLGSLLGFGILIAASQQGNAVKVPEPLEVAPIDYFEQHCSRCHGENGMNFIPGFAAKKSDEELSGTIKDMATGPGHAPLKEADIVVQLAYHRAMSEAAPFISWTGFSHDVMEGEVTPDSKMKANLGLKVDLEEGHWKIQVPDGTNLSKVEISATLHEKSAILKISESSCSQVEKKRDNEG
jgi:hypothetical protein